MTGVTSSVGLLVPHQAIIQTNDDILSIGPQATYLSGIS